MTETSFGLLVTFGSILFAVILSIIVIKVFKPSRKVELVTEYPIGNTVTDKGDRNLQKALYDLLGTSTCGKCGTSPIYKGPSAGLSMNLICKKCGQRFWIGPHREWGAYFL